jgi:phospholipid/cholesterol/gamma-HCH transport system ATP-binding protein
MNAENENIVLKAEQLKKSFRKNEVLKNVHLSLKKGETLAVLGKSGTGKSVLIKCIVRLIEPDEGKIEMLGENIAGLNANKLNKVRKKIGFLFQGAALYDSMSVRENLEFPLRDSTYSAEEINSLVNESLKNVGLSDAIHKMPSELSGGMKKRIGLARALMQKPEIMFYDEPTTGLDTITARGISNLILEIQKSHNTSSIIITHDIECARITANRMLILNDGVCAAEGTFHELENSNEKWVRDFFQ